MTTHNPIRVLQIVGIVCGGGVESVIMNYYRHIDKTKVQFDFVVDGYEKTRIDDEVQFYGGRIFHLSSYKKNVLLYMWQLYKLIKKEKYEIVHCNMNTLSIFSLLPAYLGGAKQRIIHNHSMGVKEEGVRNVMKEILRPLAPLFANHYLACSERVARWMYGRNYMKNSKLVYNAIKTEEYAFDKIYRDSYREKFNIPKTALLIGHVGRFVYPKNHLFIIDVFYELSKKNDECYLILIGDGELRKAVEKRIKELNLSDKAIILGLRDDVSKLYSAMDLFVLPSRFEGLPVVAVEAQANGLECILSDKITRECKILSNCHYLPLEINTWISTILKSNRHRINDAPIMLKDKGFDIISQAKSLVQWYEDISTK